MATRSRLRRERSLRRRHLIWRAAIPLLAAAGLVGLGYSAYQTGTLLAESRVTELNRQLNDLTSQLTVSRNDNEHLQSSVAEEKQARLILQSRYDKDVPTGDLADMFAIIRERLSQGVPAPRLQQVLREANATRVCDTRSVRRRFEIQNGKRTPEDTATLLDGLVQLTATTTSGTTESLRTAAVTVKQAWTGEPVKLTGLPARQDIVINNLVLHLVVEASPVPGYAAVTLSTCGKS
jgi:hypothetical protein